MTPAAAIEERDPLLAQAVALRRAGRMPAALSVLARLLASYPHFSRAHEERGRCLALLRDLPAAIAASCEAVRLNPTLLPGWQMLEQLYRHAGDAEQAAIAAQRLTMLRQLPPPVVEANSLHADGDLTAAERIVRAYLRTAAGNVGARRLLARICTDRGAFGEAETLLAAVLDDAPDYDAARLDHAFVLLQQHKHLQARQQAAQLLDRTPGDRDALRLYAAACVGLGDYEPVIDVYRTLLGDPHRPAAEIAELHGWRANALKITGRHAEAVAAYRAALETRPTDGMAWFGLANLKTHRFDDDDVAHMAAAAERHDLPPMDHVYLGFALGKAFEDRGDYAASWHHYARGNAARRTTSRYRPEIAARCVDGLRHVFTAEFFAERAGWGVEDAAPVFVIGLPRSGSTLIEQILASHSLVEGTHELTEIERYVRTLCGADPACGLPAHPDALRRLTADDARALGRRFLADTRPYRALGKPWFIDKMPNNFWHVGLIHLILPRATIVDVRREPMASGFSNFKQLFGTTHHEFSYDLADIARHYRAYRQLMHHWHDVLPGRVLDVRYEDVVADVDGAVRRLLAHCGLRFEPACLSFHETKRSVRTPSSEQVRQPLHGDAVAQWRHYAAWLTPLRHALDQTSTGMEA